MVELGKTNKHRGQSLLQSHLGEFTFLACFLSICGKLYTFKESKILCGQTS